MISRRLLVSLVEQRMPLFAGFLVVITLLAGWEIRDSEGMLAYWFGLTAERDSRAIGSMALVASIAALVDWSWARHVGRADLLSVPMRFAVRRALLLGVVIGLATCVVRSLTALWSMPFGAIGLVDLPRTLWFIGPPALAAAVAFPLSRVLLETHWRLVVLSGLIAACFALADSTAFGGVVAFVPIYFTRPIRHFGYDTDHPLPKAAWIPGVIALVGFGISAEFAIRGAFGVERRELKPAWSVAADAASNGYFRDKTLPTLEVVGFDDEIRQEEQLFLIDPVQRRASLVGPIGRIRRQFPDINPSALRGVIDRSAMDLLEIVPADDGGFRLERLVVQGSGAERVTPSIRGERPLLQADTQIAAQMPGVVYVGHPGDSFVHRLERQGTPQQLEAEVVVERLELPEGQRFVAFTEAFSGQQLGPSLPRNDRFLAVQTETRLWAPFVFRNKKPDWATFVDCSPLRVLEVDEQSRKPFVALGQFDGTPWKRLDIPESESRGTSPLILWIPGVLRSPIVLIASAFGDRALPLGADLGVRRHPWTLLLFALCFALGWFGLRQYLRSQRVPRTRQRLWFLAFVAFGLVALFTVGPWEAWGRGTYPSPKHKGTPRLVLRRDSQVLGEPLSGS